MSSKPRSSRTSPSTNTAKRLLQELSSAQDDILRNPSIEYLSPASDSDLYTWTCVINGSSLSHGYQHGRWLLRISIPTAASSSSSATTSTAYPLSPPTVKFLTRICASNVDLETGEVCLDLLKGKWSPAYTIASTVDAVVQMLEWPGVDSPLNVEVARMLREGDAVGAEGLVRYWCEEERYEGDPSAEKGE